MQLTKDAKIEKCNLDGFVLTGEIPHLSAYFVWTRTVHDYTFVHATDDTWSCPGHGAYVEIGPFTDSFEVLDEDGEPMLPLDRDKIEQAIEWENGHLTDEIFDSFYWDTRKPWQYTD